MKKKKKTSILTAALLILCGCSSSSASSTPSPTSMTPSETSAAVTPDDSSFSQILVDDDHIRFDITGIDHDSLWGYTWNVTLENKTDTTVMFTMENTAVNGVMSDPFWADTVTAGNKANDQITWSSSDFENNNIEKVTEVSFELKAYNSDNYQQVYLDQTFTIYPYGEENVQNDTKEAAETDIILFDNEQCAMRVTGIDPDDMWGYALKVTLVNKTAQTLMYSVDNASIDGLMCDPFWAEEVAAGKTSNTAVTWMSSTLTNAGITDTSAIQSIDLPVKVHPADDYSGNYYIDQAFTIQPGQLNQ